jgi:nickel-dependent lactate racemase
VEYFHEGGEEAEIDRRRAGELLDVMVDRLGPLRRVLLLPPDFTRLHSGAGELTAMLYERLAGRAHVEIMPALGTHAPMTRQEIEAMFPEVPPGLFRERSFRSGLHRLGEVPASYVRRISEGRVDFPIACDVDGLLVNGGWDRIVSIGQLVPHEVAGIANHNKNVYVGAGGQETINKTHFLGAVYGMERIMGRARSPVRDVFDYADEHLAGDLPVSFLLTVRARDRGGRLVTRGLFAGEGPACFRRGARLCRRVNVSLLPEPLERCVVWLDPAEYRSTWLGNKAIYRTRMAMADGGELVVLAPGVRRFGEDAGIDRLIRAHGYRGTPSTLEAVARDADLAGDLSAAAHLIHGSSEGRFTIRYAAGGLSRGEIEGAGFAWGDLDALVQRYAPAGREDGFQRTADGEAFFFVGNPALGLWGLASRFDDGLEAG